MKSPFLLLVPILVLGASDAVLDDVRFTVRKPDVRPAVVRVD